MFYATQNESLFKQFWIDEGTNFPRFWKDGANSENVTWEEFKAFCDGMWKVYSIDDVALVYVERTGEGRANMHFSLLRGEGIDTKDLIALRDILAINFPLMYAWCGKKNRGLRRILEQIGFEWKGLEMHWKQSHGKVLDWLCYTFAEVSVANRTKSLINCNQ